MNVVLHDPQSSKEVTGRQRNRLYMVPKLINILVGRPAAGSEGARNRS